MDITNKMMTYAKNKPTKEAKKVYDWLQNDYASIYADGDTVYIDLNSQYFTIPNYVYDFIHKHYKNIKN